LAATVLQGRNLTKEKARRRLLVQQYCNIAIVGVCVANGHYKALAGTRKPVSLS
jgi:hypothetical protein